MLFTLFTLALLFAYHPMQVCHFFLPLSIFQHFFPQFFFSKFLVFTSEEDWSNLLDHYCLDYVYVCVCMFCSHFTSNGCVRSHVLCQTNNLVLFFLSLHSLVSISCLTLSKTLFSHLYHIKINVWYTFKLLKINNWTTTMQ